MRLSFKPLFDGAAAAVVAALIWDCFAPGNSICVASFEKWLKLDNFCSKLSKNPWKKQLCVGYFCQEVLGI